MAWTMTMAVFTIAAGSLKEKTTGSCPQKSSLNWTDSSEHTGTHSHIFHSQTFSSATDGSYCKMTLSGTSSTGGVQIRIRVIENSVIVVNNAVNIGSTEKTVTAEYGSRVGRPDGTPTYLETLDKLDQWTSAHYVPRPKGSRDGKRRNELNL